MKLMEALCPFRRQREEHAAISERLNEQEGKLRDHQRRLRQLEHEARFVARNWDPDD